MVIKCVLFFSLFFTVGRKSFGVCCTDVWYGYDKTKQCADSSDEKTINYTTVQCSSKISTSIQTAEIRISRPLFFESIINGCQLPRFTNNVIIQVECKQNCNSFPGEYVLPPSQIMINCKPGYAIVNEIYSVPVCYNGVWIPKLSDNLCTIVGAPLDGKYVTETSDQFGKICSSAISGLFKYIAGPARLDLLGYNCSVAMLELLKEDCSAKMLNLLEFTCTKAMLDLLKEQCGWPSLDSSRYKCSAARTELVVYMCSEARLDSLGYKCSAEILHLLQYKSRVAMLEQFENMCSPPVSNVLMKNCSTPVWTKFAKNCYPVTAYSWVFNCDLEILQRFKRLCDPFTALQLEHKDGLKGGELSLPRLDF